MTGSASSPGTGRPPRRRQFPFGLVMLLFGLGLGFYGGVAATKRALTSPTWVRTLFGIAAPVTPAPAPPVAAVAPPAPSPAITAPAQPPAQTGPPPAPAAPSAAPDASQDEGAPEPQSPAAVPAPDSGEPVQRPRSLDHPTTDSTTTQPSKGAQGTRDLVRQWMVSDKSSKHGQGSRDLVGQWTVTDRLKPDSAAGSTLTTSYLFRSDNTGQYDSNGKKLFDFRWTPTGDDIAVDFDGTGPDSGQPWSVKLNWSVNADRSLLTLVPVEGKDPRAFVYSLGPGVYHRKP